MDDTQGWITVTYKRKQKNKKVKKQQKEVPVSHVQSSQENTQEKERYKRKPEVLNTRLVKKVKELHDRGIIPWVC